MAKSGNSSLSRRDALKSGIMYALGLSLMDLSKGRVPEIRPVAPAKAVIEIWMWGGPCHLDTFDPKPQAGSDYSGPFGEAIATNADGMRINGMLPRLARQADKYSLIRSMTHGVNAHETASYMMQTGRSQGDGRVYPSIGAVVSKFLGYDKGYEGLLPPYIALTTPLGRFSAEGFLGPRYKPFSTGGDPSKDPFMVEGIIAKGISDARQRKRRELLHQLDTLGKLQPNNEVFKEMDRCEEDAYTLILGEARDVFDLTREKDALREAYGRNKFGQSCLMARRLIENGVKYVSINAKGWDTHKMHFTEMQTKMPQMDQGIAALLEDLKERGLLDSVIVWCSGEFGRTPKVQWNEPWNGGRGHHGHCFSALLAGGGFRGGQVVGASDSVGYEVADRPVYPQDFLGSIYEKLGIDPDGAMPNSLGLDIPLTLSSPGKGRLHEIM